MSKRIELDPLRPVPEQLDGLRELIERAGVVLYPTDTFYGLGVDPFRQEAIERIFAIKHRETGKPILVLAADLEQVRRCARTDVLHFEHLAESFWPGPLTIVLPASEALPTDLTSGTGTVGVRWPGSDEVQAILRVCGGLLTGTSANLSGDPNPSNIAMIPDELLRSVDLVIDAGETAGGAPSTLVDLTCSPPRILREGAVTQVAIEGALGFPIS